VVEGDPVSFGHRRFIGSDRELESDGSPRATQFTPPQRPSGGQGHIGGRALRRPVS
jgi:hypothetical protein